MKRWRLIAATLFAVCAALPTPGATASAASPGSESGGRVCVWKWKKKRIVKRVRIRHAKKRGKRKFRKIVRWKRVRVRVCSPAPPPPSPARLGVKAFEFSPVEFSFILSAKSLVAGDTIVELLNAGEDDHNLHIQPVGGGTERSTADLRPGGIEQLRFVTEPGEYRLWCSLPFHAASGMDTTVTVTSRG